MSLQVDLLPNGNLSLHTDADTTLANIQEQLPISNEKKKYVTYELNGKPVTYGQSEVTPKDRLVIDVDESLKADDSTPLTFKGVPIVYEDDWCLVANKKPFLLVHGDGKTEDKLTSRVNAHLAEEGWPFAAQPVNRIDQEASGLVLFCKHPLLQSFFDRQMENGTAKKEYLAVVNGRVENREMDLNNPIGRDRHDDKMIVFRKGKPSHTHVSRLKLLNDMSLVKADITTGRRHQIRVHLANQGYPIFNDPLYGTVSNNKGLMLQAYRLSFDQPFTNKRISLELPMDTRFKWFDPELAKNA